VSVCVCVCVCVYVCIHAYVSVCHCALIIHLFIKQGGCFDTYSQCMVLLFMALCPGVCVCVCDI